MATRKITKAIPAKTVAAKPAPVVSTTPVRNSAVPPKTGPVVAKAKAPIAVTREQIAIRAYEIWRSRGGNEHDNWVQAERELKGL